MQARRLLLLPLTVILFNIASCGQQNVNGNTKKPMYTNELIHETSPYLLQHAHNPVNWYPWGDKALDKAKKENKMLLISVGYAACHWCHVMEHECYEDTMVANLMNKNFVCIKVDREERPDVDQVYMNAAYLINGNGGWPLNALAMPDGKPFFAGTYFPKKDWMHVLEYFSGLYETDRQKLAEQANNVSQGIKDIENVPLNTSAVSYSINTLNNLYDSFKNSADLQQGGTLGNIKFPMPCLWEYLLQYNYLSSNKDALKSVESTLDNMAKGGIYDQIGGGFARYSTDAKWHAPHFEKMLYDNAQLISLYSHAYQVTANPLYKQIVYETIAFVQRELTSAEGGFYSSLDADSEGEEGRFYVWSDSELKAILGNDAALFSDYFGITANGNWESGKNIPDINYGNKNIEAKYHLTQDQLLQKINTLKKVVLAARNKRVRPHTDDKILTAWNALMVNGLVDAYQAFGEESFLNLAKTNIDFLLKNMMQKDGSLFRNYKNHQANIPAFLDDYAFTISALTNYYQVSFDINYLHKADALIQYVQQHFYDKTSGMFFYTDDLHSNLIARKMEVGDNVIPSSNSEMAKNFLKLGLYFDNKDYSSTAAQLIKNIEGTIGKNLQFYGNWAQAIALQVKAPYEIAIAGNDWQKKLASFQTHYLPNAVFLGGEKEDGLALMESKIVAGKTMIYVCENQTCQRPVENVADALMQVKP